MTLIDPNMLDKVREDVATARGLPNSFYTERDVFELEKRTVFGANWACIGFAKDIPNPGDAKPIDFLDQPYLAVRGKDGEVRVFENICRHRGMILLEESKSTNGIIRCPYHSWCYGLDGSLRTTPHVGGPGQNTHDCINRDELGLNEIRSHVWMDMIFVNLSGSAAPFEEYAARVIGRWAEFQDKPLYHGGPESSFFLDVNTNWKLAVENYCEAYHLPWVHPGLNSYSRLEDHYNIVEPGRYSGQGTVVYNPSLEDNGNRFANFEGLSDKWDTGAEYIALYPNVLLGIHRDHFYGILLEPVNETRTIERVEIYYTRQEDTGDDFATLRAKNAAMWREIFEEDVFVVEGMQSGRRAAHFDGGKFSPVMDAPTHNFHHWVAGEALREL
ncbi:MAG: aromatic ring-hydroxylating oxygenase subunit alpha [Hyphomicrobiales bacterium]